MAVVLDRVDEYVTMSQDSSVWQGGKSGRVFYATLPVGRVFVESAPVFNVYETRKGETFQQELSSTFETLSSGAIRAKSAWIAETAIPSYCTIRFMGTSKIKTSYVEPTMVDNVANTTAEISYGTTYADITLKCDDGYKFDGTPTAKLAYDDDPFADEVEIALTINSDGDTATGEVLISDLSQAATITFTGNTKAKTSYVEPTINNAITNTTAKITYGDSYAVVTIDCATGYMFDGTPTAKLVYDNPFADEIEVTLALNTDSTQATGTLSLSDLSEESTLNLTGSTKASSKPTPTFVNGIEETTWEHVYSDGKYKVTITCNSGYVFDGTPYINYKNLETEVQGEVNLTLDDTNSIGYAEIETSEYTDLTAIGSTIIYVSPTKVTNNVTNADYSGSIVGTMINGTLSATKTNGAFVNIRATYTDLNSDTQTITLKPDSAFDSTIKVLISKVMRGTEVVLNGLYRGVCKTENNVTGASVLNLKDFYIEGESVNIALSANNGTSFKTNPKLVWYDVLSVPTEVAFELSADGKSANLNWTMPTDADVVEYTSLEITGSTQPDTEIKGYGSVNVYCVDTDALESFAQARFKYKDTTETGLTPDGDLGEYVNRLHKVYCDVGETTDTTIKCGNNDTKIACKSINNAVVNVDFGFVTIPKYTNNTNDLNNKIQVFVPFVGFVGVDSEYMGATMFLTYDIDLVTGEGVYTLETDSIIITQGVCDCSNDVIYRTSQTETLNTIGSDKFKSTYLLGLKPYVKVGHYDEMPDSRNDTLQQVVLSTISGFAKFDNFNVNVNCLADEQSEIQTLLSSGVIL